MVWDIVQVSFDIVRELNEFYFLTAQ